MSNHKIKILSPIDRVKEAVPLIKAGADAFYCGVIINNKNLSTRRIAGIKRSNLDSLNEFGRLTQIVRRNRKKIILNLNIPHDDINAFRVIEQNMKRIKKIRPDSIIVGNINLMERLRKYGIQIIASSLLEIKNKETTRFLVEKFGVKHIILDRQITLDDLDGIVAEFPQIKLEVFIQGSGCRSLNGACNRHLVTKSNKLGIHLCLSSFDIDKKNRNHYLDSGDKKIIAGRMRMPLSTCGVCALYHFNKYPVRFVKIVGRCFRINHNFENVIFIKQALDILNKNYSEKKYYQAIENLFKDRFKRRCNRQFCYYPHFMR